MTCTPDLSVAPAPDPRTATADPERPPHVLTLTARSGHRASVEHPHRWDHAGIACPCQPPSALMPCAVWSPCGCPPSELDGGQLGLCRNSETGEHRYFDGEPGRPTAECFAVQWDDELPGAASDLDLPVGIYLVHPYWDDGLRLRLVDSRVAAR